MMAARGDLESMAWNRFLTGAGNFVALLGTCLGAAAQGYPVPPGAIPGGQQQLCLRLESQLAAISRGPDDPARAAQISRTEESLRRQQAELDRTIDRSRRLGCERTGFFSLFTNQPAECGPIQRQVQELRAYVDRLMMEMQRARGDTADRESQRRSVLIALSENNCGPQYRSAAANQQRGLFDSLFGTSSIPVPGASDVPGVPQSSTYRTLCVRTCDGYYWPISFSTVPSRFGEDDRACQRMCPAAQVVLFTHRNPGEEVAQATSLSGQTYGDMPNAFLYRKQVNPSCSCKRTGETWAHALKHLDDSGERGDIVVTEERAKELSKPQQQRPSRTPARGARDAAAQPQEASPPQESPAIRGTAGRESIGQDGRTVRSVGPTFLPAPESPALRLQ
jgi:hypothetical protein